MALRKLGEQRGDLPSAKCDRRIETKQSPRLDAISGDGSVGRLDVGENAFGGFEVTAPGLSDRKPPRAAVKELHASAGLRARRCAS